MPLLLHERKLLKQTLSEK